MGERLVVIGGSAGAVEGLHRLIRALPADFPAPVCAVIHLGTRSPSVLAAVLGRGARVPVSFAVDGAPLVPGEVLIAPPDRHMVITAEGVALQFDAKENHCRPAIDPLFRTGARIRGAGCIGVILSGSLDDGSAGLAAVKEAGGVAIVQSPGDALVADMPRNAIQRTAIDYALPLDDIAPLLVRVASQSDPSEVPDAPLYLDPRAEGTPALLACPDCQGTLWRLGEVAIWNSSAVSVTPTRCRRCSPRRTSRWSARCGRPPGPWKRRRPSRGGSKKKRSGAEAA